MRPNVAILGSTGLFVLLFSVGATADETDTESIVYGFGTPATIEEIAAWNIDVMPDGEGLPPGRGTAVEGAEIYAVQCAACHGFNGEGGLNDRLVVNSRNEAFPDADDPNSGQHRTIGNYWPYATTVFDYIRRSMPFNLPGSLEDDEVYALTAHLLYLNNIIPENAEMNAETLPQVNMPAQGKFIVDDRHEYKEVH
ncbi:MAG: c-type cytochrome [Gammaproteobacteria bacterium]